MLSLLISLSTQESTWNQVTSENKKHKVSKKEEKKQNKKIDLALGTQF